MWDQLLQYISFIATQRAIIVAILIALCASLLGVTLVLKRFSFIGDGLSHVAFGAMAVAGVVGFSNNTLLVLPITIVAAILLLRTGKNTKIQGDAVLAMISVGALALGYLIMNLFKSKGNIAGDVCTTLFGSMSILTLTKVDVIICTSLSIFVIALFIIFYNKIFAVTFDENFAKAVGTHADIYNLLIAIIIALVIVAGMKLVGSLLISALVIFPSLSAMRVFKSFKSVTICSATISIICAILGLIISLLYSTPTGSTIVAADIFIFLVFSIIGKIKN